MALQGATPYPWEVMHRCGASSLRSLRSLSWSYRSRCASRFSGRDCCKRSGQRYRKRSAVRCSTSKRYCRVRMVQVTHADDAFKLGLARLANVGVNDTTPQYEMPVGADIVSCVLRNSGDREATDLTMNFPHEYVGWRNRPRSTSDKLYAVRYGSVNIGALQSGEEAVVEVYNSDSSFAADFSMGGAALQYRF
jgi:hypothetical protein